MADNSKLTKSCRMNKLAVISNTTGSTYPALIARAVEKTALRFRALMSGL